ncbi:hypothetical protein L596_019326 [Steinernema carpocapsae]|uniref:Peptidase S1 domain-containing protein n=1 Tax=Steinernema carpocapsae TaxID=34508 RepID=A0A4U5MQA9_STECR|nr:hypothetical protein L596_019326 [Steinernema carpocapsae]
MKGEIERIRFYNSLFELIMTQTALSLHVAYSVPDNLSGGICANVFCQASFATTCHKLGSPSVQIIRGTSVHSLADFPFVVYIKIEGKRVQKCTGSLLTARHVLTAAHCFREAQEKDVTVFFKTTSRARYVTCRHPYCKKTAHNTYLYLL